VHGVVCRYTANLIESKCVVVSPSSRRSSLICYASAAPPLIGGGIKRWCCLTSVYLSLTSVCRVHLA